MSLKKSKKEEYTTPSTLPSSLSSSSSIPPANLTVEELWKELLKEKQRAEEEAKKVKRYQEKERKCKEKMAADRRQSVFHQPFEPRAVSVPLPATPVTIPRQKEVQVSSGERSVTMKPVATTSQCFSDVD
jgi:hypothetical protein